MSSTVLVPTCRSKRFMCRFDAARGSEVRARTPERMSYRHVTDLGCVPCYGVGRGPGPVRCARSGAATAPTRSSSLHQLLLPVCTDHGLPLGVGQELTFLPRDTSLSGRKL